ncbi:hypothetical protein CSPX01_05629 [Colletotrichum filicis]|nr:hypothetical protein CSPX01_05629 [Colletotrichum filicis]
MRGQSPIPTVAFALPHLITPVATAALLVPELLPTGPGQSAAAVPERHAPNQRHHRRSRVPKKAGRDWVSAAVLRRRRRSRPTVTADASGVFGLGAEVVGSIRAVSGSLISDIFSVPVVLPEAPATTLTS